MSKSTERSEGFPQNCLQHRSPNAQKNTAIAHQWQHAMPTGLLCEQLRHQLVAGDHFMPCLLACYASSFAINWWPGTTSAEAAPFSV